MLIKFFIFLIKFIFVLGTFSSASAQTTPFDVCPMNGDKIDVSEIANISTGGASGTKVCDAPVSSFNITVHQLTMCTSDPTEYLKGNSAEDPCFYLWDTNRGDTAISFGVTKSSAASFPATLPPTGVYTHGFGTLSTTLEINSEFEFDEAKIIGGNSEGTGWYSAPFLNSPQKFLHGGDRNVTMKDLADELYSKFTETFTESQSSFNDYSFTYNSLSTVSFLNTLEREYAAPHNGNYGRALLLNNNNQLATSYDDATKLISIEDYSSPVTITDDINTIIYKYSPDQAARLTFSPVGSIWIVTSILFGNTQFTIEFE